MRSKVFFLSGSRADYSLIGSIFLLFKNNKHFEKKIILTGTNLSKKKYSDDEKFNISKRDIYKIHIKLESSNKKDFSNIFSNYFNQFYNLLEKNKPEYVIVLGDRYEALIFAICARFLNIKIIHFHGGETTLGSLDNTWRDIISRLSDYHFTSLSLYKNKLTSLGINKKNIFNVGSVGASNMAKYKIKKNLLFQRNLNLIKKF